MLQWNRIVGLCYSIINIFTSFCALYISVMAWTSLGFSCNFRIAVSLCDTIEAISAFVYKKYRIYYTIYYMKLHSVEIQRSFSFDGNLLD